MRRQDGRGSKKVQGSSRNSRRTAAPAPDVRLQKYLADCGIASRRKSEELILERRVTVNGKPAALGDKVFPDEDKVLLDGKLVKPHRRSGPTYLVMNKPRGYLVTAEDPEGRKTIYELLTDIKDRVIPVGRLDKDSEGLLILTNDGELAHRLMHPSYRVEKEYEVRLRGKVPQSALTQLREGIEIEGGKTQPAEVHIIEESELGTRLSITIAEGRKRQVRHMCDAVGFDVKRLLRVREGHVLLGRMRPGQVRALTREEVSSLKREVGLSGGAAAAPAGKRRSDARR